MSNIGTTLLSNSLEGLQSVEIDGAQIVISANDVLSIGEGDKSNVECQKKTCYIFTENLKLNGNFAFKDGIVSTQILSTVGDAKFSTNGKDGEDAVNIKDGENGENAGVLNVFYSFAVGDKPPMKLTAIGGKGGNGKNGLNNADGSNGGNGGDGGEIRYIIGIVANDLLIKFNELDKFPNLEQKKQFLKGILTNIRRDLNESKDLKQVIVDIENAIKITNEDKFISSINMIGLRLDTIRENYESDAKTTSFNGGGKYGTYGKGAVNARDGKNGESGKSGSKTITLFSNSENLINQDFDKQFFIIHPSQSTRMLEHIKLMYLTLNPTKQSSKVKEIITLLLRLQQRTQLFITAEDDSNLIKYYNENESKFGAIGAVAQLRNIYHQSTQYLSQIKSGNDFYGYEANYVPLASFSFYKELLDQMIDKFADVEKAYNEYFKLLKDSKPSIELIKKMREEHNSVKINAKNKLNALKFKLQKTAIVIDSYESILAPLKQNLKDVKEELKDEIKTHFNFDVDMMDILTSVTSAPTSQFELISDAGDFLYEAETNVTDDDGKKVKKEYILKQLKAVESSVENLKEGYKSLDNGTLQPDDPGAGKLIIEADKLKGVMDKFKSTFGSKLKKLKKAFTRYISKVQERNSQILIYNSTLQLIVKNNQIIKQVDERRATLNDKVLQNLDNINTLPDLTSFVSNLYYTIRSQIMETLNLTARAFRFWALSDKNLISEAYGGKAPPQINHTVLVSAQGTILKEFRKAIEEFGTNHSLFPNEQSKVGVMVKVPQYQVDLMKSKGEFIVRPKTPTLDTSIKESSFAGMANIRVKYVRVWVEGAKSYNNQLRVRIRHLGREEIVNTSGKIFSFVHDSINKMFVYDMDTKQISQEANFGIEHKYQGADKTYAAIGPFADWQIQILDKDNLGLNLSKVTKITLEFHTTNYLNLR